MSAAPSRTSRVLAAALLGGALAAMSCGAPQKVAPARRGARHVQSNVLRSDYAGSSACRSCHTETYDAFIRSPMHRMTRVASGDSIRAPFDGSTYSFKGDSVTVEQQGGQRYMRLKTAEKGPRLYRITKVIGGRFREDYAGVEVSEVDRRDLPRHGKSERIMPLSYLLFDSSWRYKGYSVMVEERPYLTVGVAWRQTCIFCHNTAPHLSTIYDDLTTARDRNNPSTERDRNNPSTERDGNNPSTGRVRYQGSISDRALPPARTWRYQVRDDEGLARALSDEVRHLGGDADESLDAQEALQLAARTTREHFDAEHLVELGIGCEACHNGSREHAQNPAVLPSFEIQSSLVAVRGAAKQDPSRAEWINRTCARCHTVLFNHYPYTWEGGERSAPVPGGSHINSGEARDFLLGGCASQMACTSCHDPHRGSDPARLSALGEVSGNAVCTGCHRDLAAEPALARHTHHRTDGEGSACLSCHMPRKNMGLGYRLTRYHRIGSPTDRARVEQDRPLECALCHVDTPTGTLVATMERWWNKRYDRRRLGDLYGDLSASPLLPTLQRGKPHEVAVAVAVLGERGARTVAPVLARQLTHPFPLVRFWTRASLERLTGKRMDIDLDADPESIRAAASRWLGETDTAGTR